MTKTTKERIIFFENLKAGIMIENSCDSINIEDKLHIKKKLPNIMVDTNGLNDSKDTSNDIISDNQISNSLNESKDISNSFNHNKYIFNESKDISNNFKHNKYIFNDTLNSLKSNYNDSNVIKRDSNKSGEIIQKSVKIKKMADKLAKIIDMKNILQKIKTKDGTKDKVVFLETKYKKITEEKNILPSNSSEEYKIKLENICKEKIRSIGLDVINNKESHCTNALNTKVFITERSISFKKALSFFQKKN